MAAPEYVPVKPMDDVRTYESPPRRPDPWIPRRPGEVRGSNPRGESFGDQGPDQGYVSPYTVAAIYAGLGEKDQAFKLLEKAYEARDIWLVNLKIDPVLAPLRSDQRFQNLLERIGLAP